MSATRTRSKTSKKSRSADSDEAPTTTIEEMYQKKTQREHILDRPDSYVGSVEKDEMVMWVFSEQVQRLVKKKVEIVPALYKIYDEVLVNAQDHAVRTRNPDEGARHKTTEIRVSIDQETGRITVFNNGDGIDVAMHQEHEVWVPEMIFGQLLTGRNFNDDEERVVGGRNGYGAKLANIYSREFTIETIDHKSKQKYVQTFRDNMTNVGEPEITRVAGRVKPYTQISFLPEYERFGLEGLTDDMLALMKKRVHDIAACTQTAVKVYLNEEQIEIRGLQGYMDFYFPEEESVKVYEQAHDRWKVGAVYRPDGGYEQLSYVNGICTYKGGTHVKYVADQIADKLITIIKKKHKTINLKPQQIKDQLTIFVDATIVNPTFGAQTKDELVTKVSKFGSRCTVSDNFVKKLAKTGIVDDIVSLATLKEQRDLQKSSSGRKTTKLRGIAKLDDANFAGGRKSNDCTLILTEGDSAKSMVVGGYKVLDRNYVGVFPLKGKLLNVREKMDKVRTNEEIQNLVTILGLKFGTEYQDTSSLRYGRVMILTDQDVDGFHIKGLFVNFLHHFWPSLLRLNTFVTTLSTPIVKAFKGKKQEVFFNMRDYETWKETHSRGWTVKYYKGLGTSSSSEAVEYFTDLEEKLIRFRWSDETVARREVPYFKMNFLTNAASEMSQDAATSARDTDCLSVSSSASEAESVMGDPDQEINKCDEAIHLAFDKKRTNDRKRWLGVDDHEGMDVLEQDLTYDQFVHRQLIMFSHDDNERSLPGLDGLKVSLRKILYSAFKKVRNSELKVAQLAGFVSEHTHYHHGEASLLGAIINMAQDYLGSNNINLLKPNGQFGSRLMGGKDAASPRYIHTQLNLLATKIFREDDLPVLEYTDDDGVQTEPKTYYPVIPMLLVNGADGIGTGYSSKVPCFNPQEVIDNIRKLLSGEEMVEMAPWYRNFQGTIVKGASRSSYLIRGCYEQIDDDTLEITELPVGLWTQDYKMFVESLLQDTATDKKKKAAAILTDFSEHHTDVTVKFVLHFVPGKLQKLIDSDKLEKTLKLVKSLSISNMRAHNEDGTQIIHYGSALDVIRNYYPLRVACYDRRRTWQLGQLQREIDMLHYKVLFIRRVLSGEIVIMKNNRALPKAKWVEQFEEQEFPELTEKEDETPSYNYLTGMKILTLTDEEISKLEEKLAQKREDYETLEGKTPEDIWRDELEELQEEYEIWSRTKNQEFEQAQQGVMSAKKKKTTRRRAPRKVKVV